MKIKFTIRETAIMQEAFMTGRIYTALGEKESPIEIFDKLCINCINAIKRCRPVKPRKKARGK